MCPVPALSSLALTHAGALSPKSPQFSGTMLSYEKEGDRVTQMVLSATPNHDACHGFTIKLPKSTNQSAVTYPQHAEANAFGDRATDDKFRALGPEHLFAAFAPWLNDAAIPIQDKWGMALLWFTGASRKNDAVFDDNRNPGNTWTVTETRSPHGSDT